MSVVDIERFLDLEGFSRTAVKDLREAADSERRGPRPRVR